MSPETTLAGDRSCRSACDKDGYGARPPTSQGFMQAGLSLHHVRESREDHSRGDYRWVATLPPMGEDALFYVPAVRGLDSSCRNGRHRPVGAIALVLAPATGARTTPVAEPVLFSTNR